MRPLRLLVTLSTSFIAVALLLYAALGSPPTHKAQQAAGSPGSIKALFSFNSPTSLFPPSAIISLTDDNSTFFLARPAAFGPLLPKEGLSSPLWIGSGFGDDALGWAGELGCGDIPGWDPDSEGLLASPRRRAHVGSRAATSTSANDAAIPGNANIQSLQESAEIAGKVVLLKRGGCGFLAKVQWAQRRGGVAVIVGDHVRGGALVRMYAKGDTSNITIPSLFTSHTTAHLLSSLLPSQRIAHTSAASNTAYTKPSNNDHGLDRIKGDEAQGGRMRRPTSINQKPQTTVAASHILSESVASPKEAEGEGLFRSLLSALGFHREQDKLPKAGSRRIPGSGDLDWTDTSDWDNDEDPIKTKSAAPMATSTRSSDGFVIGKQDWRDPDLLPSSATMDASASAVETTPSRLQTAANVLPGSGEYSRVDMKKPKQSWWKRLVSPENAIRHRTSSVREARSVTSITGADLEIDTTSSPMGLSHEGLWVTLTPTNVSTSPFFDTLLVLVVSPLVTLTVVYALLLLRSRIRRRRWRAPKSVVERLPVRTYQTISESSATPTPGASSPTTPLLQHFPEQSPSSVSRPRSQHASSELPGTSSAVQHAPPDRTEEKRETGLAAWRRRYGGRQKECVVCLEEYEDGVSQVMSLPCGHEFHADCITPWLVTRRRTCPICKGDVVRSLSQSYHDRLQPSSTTESPGSLDDSDDLQAQAVHTRNDSPSASRPLPISTSAPGMYAPPHDDVETGWTQSNTSHEPQDAPGTSYRELSSTVSTVIWRGLDAVRASAGLQRRQPPGDVDRDR